LHSLRVRFRHRAHRLFVADEWFFFDEKSPAAWGRRGKVLPLQAIFKDSTGMVLAQIVCNVFSLHQPAAFGKL
jgi:hypothetical protein